MTDLCPAGVLAGGVRFPAKSIVARSAGACSPLAAGLGPSHVKTHRCFLGRPRTFALGSWDELVSWQELARSTARIARETRRGSPDGCAQKFQTETVFEKQQPQKRRTNQRPCCSWLARFNCRNKSHPRALSGWRELWHSDGAGAGWSSVPCRKPSARPIRREIHG